MSRAFDDNAKATVHILDDLSDSRGIGIDRVVELSRVNVDCPKVGGRRLRRDIEKLAILALNKLPFRPAKTLKERLFQLPDSFGASSSTHRTRPDRRGFASPVSKWPHGAR